jgi:hypothetical protein
MDSKRITRRVVIGTVLSGLAAGPFVIRYLRKTKNISESEYDNSQHGLVKIDPAIVSVSDISEKDIRRAYEQLWSVCDMWQKIKGIRAETNIITNINGISQQEQKFECRGFLSFDLKSLRTDSHSGFSCTLDFTSPDSKWLLEMKGGHQRFEGSKENLAVEPSLLPTMLIFPAVTLPSLCPLFPKNTCIPFAHPTGESDAFVFKAVEGVNTNMEVSFYQGHFEKSVSQKQDKTTVMLYEDYERIENDLFYPKLITYSLKSQDISASCIIKFENLKILV